MKRFRYRDRMLFDTDFIKQSSGLCSAASVANACRALGFLYKYSPVTETVAALAMNLNENAVEVGADEKQIVRGLLALGFKTRRRRPTTHVVRALNTRVFENALAALGEAAVIASVDNGSHWLVLVSDDNHRPVVIDADNTKPMLARISATELERRWRNDGVFYGVTVR